MQVCHDVNKCSELLWSSWWRQAPSTVCTAQLWESWMTSTVEQRTRTHAMPFQLLNVAIINSGRCKNALFSHHSFFASFYFSLLLVSFFFFHSCFFYRPHSNLNLASSRSRQPIVCHIGLKIANINRRNYVAIAMFRRIFFLYCLATKFLQK